MFLPAWLMLFGAIVVLSCWKTLRAFLKRYLRIRALVNKIPGPPTIPIFGNAYNLQWDAVGSFFFLKNSLRSLDFYMFSCPEKETIITKKILEKEVSEKREQVSNNSK